MTDWLVITLPVLDFQSITPQAWFLSIERNLEVHYSRHHECDLSIHKTFVYLKPIDSLAVQTYSGIFDMGCLPRPSSTNEAVSPH